MLLSISLKIDILMNGEVQITDLVVSKLLRYKLKKLQDGRLSPTYPNTQYSLYHYRPKLV